MMLLYRKVHGLRLYYRDWGEGADLVLLVHGALVPSVLWESVGPRLAAPGRHVVAPDFIGWGSSDKPRERTYGFDSLYRDLRDAVTAFRPAGRMVIVAHDTAAVPALRLALDSGRPPAGLVLVEPWLAGDRERLPELVRLAGHPVLGRILLGAAAARRQVRALVRNPSLLSAAAVSALVGPFRTDPGALRALRGLARDLLRRAEEIKELRARLKEVPCPLLVLSGGADPYRPHEAASGLAREAGVEAVFVPGGGHLVPLERPQEVSQAIGRFLSQTLAAPEAGTAEAEGDADAAEPAREESAGSDG